MTDKILYLVSEDWYFCSHRLKLAIAAREHGYAVVVATQNGEYADTIIANGFTLIPVIVYRSITSFYKELWAVFRLYKIYKNVQPDLVHHVSLKPSLTGSIAAWFAGVPHVVNAYTGLGHAFISRSLLMLFIVFAILPTIGLLLKGRRVYSIVQNNDDKEALLESGLINPARTVLIRGSGVDTSEFSVSPEPDGDKLIVLFASRLLKDKGIYEYIHAIGRLKETGVSARFVIVGDCDVGNPTSISRSELDNWMGEGLIEWWGHHKDMSRVFKQVHIVCLPSYREGLPKVLLEAAASGRPIVTTDVAGCREVVVNGLNGFLVPVKDPVALADSIRKLIDSAELRRQMGQAGRKRVEENFALDIINRNTVALYDELMGQRKTA